MSLFVSALIASFTPLFAPPPSTSPSTPPSTPPATSPTTSPPAANAASPSLYYGVHVPGQLYDYSAVTQMQNDAGKNASIVMMYQGWAKRDGAENFEAVWMDNIRNHGSIPMVTWEPWDYLGDINQPAYSLNSIISGAHDSYITQFALDAKAWGHPFFLRFAHEMNGDWYPWNEGINGNTPGQYVQAWRHVHDLFTANGVTNVTWVWSPNIEYTGSIPLSGLYPGDAYTDWIAMDGYNWGATQIWKSWQTFSDLFGPTYNDITSLSQKPLLVGETASTELTGDKANWITSALTTEIFNYPRIKGFIWFNEDKETDWRIESSPSAQAAFSSAVANPVYAGNSFGDLPDGPILPLG
jgi:beta-mannanase